MIRSLRQTLRALRRRPAFSLTAILTLAVGIGASITAFTIVRSVLLEPLPFREPDRLLGVELRRLADPATAVELTYPDWQMLRQQAAALQDVAAHASGTGRLLEVDG